MKMLKKSVSVLLSLIMVWGVFSAAPFCVGAATVVTTWQQLVSAVSSGGSVILGADITSGPFDSFCISRAASALMSILTATPSAAERVAAPKPEQFLR